MDLYTRHRFLLMFVISAALLSEEISGESLDSWIIKILLFLIFTISITIFFIPLKWIIVRSQNIKNIVHLDLIRSVAFTLAVLGASATFRILDKVAVTRNLPEQVRSAQFELVCSKKSDECLNFVLEKKSLYSWSKTLSEDKKIFLAQNIRELIEERASQVSKTHPNKSAVVMEWLSEYDQGTIKYFDEITERISVAFPEFSAGQGLRKPASSEPGVREDPRRRRLKNRLRRSARPDAD